MPKPKMKKFGQQRGTKTREIPVVVYPSDMRAIDAAAADQRPKGKATRMPSGPRVGGVSEIFGTKISSSPGGGATFNPGSGLGETI